MKSKKTRKMVMMCQKMTKKMRKRSSDLPSTLFGQLIIPTVLYP
jgi:hypothetical protein